MKVKSTFSSIAFAVSIAFSLGAVSTAFGEPLAAPAPSFSSQPSVKAYPGRIEICVPGDEARQVVIYSLTGQVVKSFTAQPGVTAIDLSAGYYIVKCDRTSTRVVVK